MSQINAQKTPSKAFGIVYVLLMAASTLYKYFLTVSLPWWSVQLCYIAISMLCCAWILVTGELSRVGVSIKATLLLLSPYVLIVLYSTALWLFRLQSISYIWRGLVDLGYLMLSVIMVGCSAMVFGEKVMDLTFFGFAIGNALIAMSVVQKYGMGAVAQDMLAFAASGFEEDTVITKTFEIHSLTFALGVLLYGILLERMKNFRKTMCAVTGMFFLLLGWKRSLFLAIAVGLLLYCMTRNTKKRTAVWKMKLFGITMMAVALGYVYYVHSGIYDLLIEKYGIEVMGRNILYDTFKEVYDISFGYMGQGSGFISAMLKELQEMGRTVLNGELSIHSDILGKYIELGLPCYLLWSYLEYSLMGTVLARHFSERAGRVWMGCIALCYVTYFTDNTAGYMPVIVAMCCVAMSAIFEEKQELSVAKLEIVRG